MRFSASSMTRQGLQTQEVHLEQAEIVERAAANTG